MKPQVTILILSHNRSWSLAQTLASIREWTSVPYRILVRDHGSDMRHRAHIAAYATHPRATNPVEIQFHDRFYSCLAGRRLALDDVETPYTVFLDDDCRVGPSWLRSMLAVMQGRPNCGAVAANLLNYGKPECGGTRYREGTDAKQHPFGYTGQAEFCVGGATLYLTEALRRTEYREEFDAGFEDWDQTLQMTQDLGYTVWGSKATVFHRHLPDYADYGLDRWRMTELFDAAIAAWRRWQIASAIRTVMAEMQRLRLRPQPHQFRAFEEVMCL